MKCQTFQVVAEMHDDQMKQVTCECAQFAAHGVCRHAETLYNWIEVLAACQHTSNVRLSVNLPLRTAQEAGHEL